MIRIKLEIQDAHLEAREHGSKKTARQERRKFPVKRISQQTAMIESKFLPEIERLKRKRQSTMS
jgi:hypothetical protein